MFKRRPTTVEGAIQGLLQAVSDLEHVATVCGDRCSANRAMVEDLETRIKSDEAEKSRAEVVAAKLREITEG